jgi:Cu/Ag efflux protein CusF
MKRMGSWMTAACAVSAFCLATAARAQAPGSPPETISAAHSTAKATITSVDLKKREVGLKWEDGHTSTFVAGDEVKNLDQVKKGDQVTTTYKESLAYEVKKGGTASDVKTSASLKQNERGQVPAGVWSQVSTWTAEIAAIDPAIPQVTLKGSGGKTRTIKVDDPKKLEGVKVGDTVQVTWVETVDIQLARAAK